jgi:hypothetical protein
LVQEEFFERLKKAPREFEGEKKDPRGPRCFECSSFGLTMEISSRGKERHTMRLSVMSLKKKKLLSRKNF